MRLTCPNCGARYEVPDDVIPPEGRDVQCSNCGNTWFEGGAGTAPAAEPAGGTSAFEDYPEPEPTGAAADPAPAPQPEPEPEPEPEPAREPEPEPVQDTAEEDAAPAPEPEPEDAAAPAAAPERRKPRLDPKMADILREEAAREAELRSGGLESQTELGLEPATPPEPDENARRDRQSRDRMARMRGENPAEIEAEETGSRRGLLPDIEEINSTLRAGTPAAQAQPPAEPETGTRRRGGFRSGFLLTLLIAIVLGGIYAKAPEIAQAVPQADPAVSSYVALVDQARIWLDGQLRAVMAN